MGKPAEEAFYTCLETGETKTLTEWARKLKNRTWRGSTEHSVKGAILKAVRERRKAYGLTFAKAIEVAA